MSVDNQRIIYDDVARTIASVAIALGSYSLVDRLANALSSDAVYRAIYELSRNLDAMKTGSDTSIKQVEREGKRYIEIVARNKGIFRLFGGLAAPSRMQEFLEESNRDIRIPRSVAAYAMYLAASSRPEEVGTQ
jgi:CRISPR type I-A-associated protein Csa5